jgi:hypothetical protein
VVEGQFIGDVINVSRGVNVNQDHVTVTLIHLVEGFLHAPQPLPRILVAFDVRPYGREASLDEREGLTGNPGLIEFRNLLAEDVVKKEAALVATEINCLVGTEIRPADLSSVFNQRFLD